MIQCYTKKGYDAKFKSLSQPSLLYVSKTTEDAGAQSRIMHSHEDYLEVILICSGEGEYLIGGKKRTVKHGDVVIYNSNVVHDEASDPEIPIRRYCCAIGNLQLEGLRSNALIEDQENPVFKSGSHFDAMRNLFETMYELLSEGSQVAEEACHYLLMSLLALTWDVLHQSEDSESGEKEDVSILAKRIKRYIDNHFTEELTLQSMADALNMSHSYLSHVFKDEIGYAPLQYVMRRRIGEAQTLLISTDHSITAIASMVGYPNPSHFNAVFTKHVGLSPRKYRINYIVNKNPFKD